MGAAPGSNEPTAINQFPPIPVGPPQGAAPVTPDWRTCDCGWQRAYYRDMRQQRDAFNDVEAELDRALSALRGLVRKLRDCTHKGEHCVTAEDLDAASEGDPR